MRKILTIIFLLVIQQVYATHYYVAISGSDTNSGTSTGSPWQSISKVNATTFSRGDIISFNGGDSFFGQLTPSVSGTSGSPITYNSYGTGQAIINGFNTINGWTSVGINLWESSSSVTALSDVRMVVISGVITPMGRTPNTGWYTYQTFTGNTSLTSSNLTGTPNWAGAEAVIRSQDWLVDRYSINSQSGSTLNVTDLSGSTQSMKTNYGFYIQNDVRTLDTTNEWYFEPSTKKIEIYGTSAPAVGSFQVANLQHLFFDSLYNYITVSNLSFQGANDDAVHVPANASNVKIENCTVKYAGHQGIYLEYGSNNRVDSCTVQYTNSNGIALGGNSPKIMLNLISDVGLVTGLANTTDDDAILNFSNGIQDSVYGNFCYRIGGDAIAESWKGTYVGYNFVDSSSMITNDHSGIYSPAYIDTVTNLGRVYDHNIILKTIGNGSGTPNGSMGEGLYIDDDAYYMTVTNNTIAYSGNHNLKLHGGHYDTVYNNTTYSSPNGIGIQQDGSTGQGGNVWKKNISVALSGQYSAQWRTDNTVNDFSTFGNIDSNYYASTTPSSAIDAELYYSPTYYSVSSWASYSSLDTHSSAAPATYTDADTRFIYNPTFSDSIVSLASTYQDIKGTQYNSGSIVIHPFESAVLFKTGALPTGGGGTPTVTSIWLYKIKKYFINK